jgi:hypothetical protein
MLSFFFSIFVFVFIVVSPPPPPPPPFVFVSSSSPAMRLKSPNRRPILYNVIGKRKQERMATRKIGNSAATVSDGVSSEEEEEEEEESAIFSFWKSY